MPRLKEHPVLSLRVAPGTKLVWLYLKTWAGPDRQFRFNVTDAAEDLGVSRSTVYRALTCLQRAGFIEWERSKGGGNGDRCGMITMHERPRDGRTDR